MADSKDYFDFLNKLENDPEFCFKYIQDNCFDKRHPTYEQCLKTISEDAECSLKTAQDIIKGKFELGENAISKNPSCSYWYAKDVIKQRFELGEPSIARNDQYSFDYARNVIRGRFEMGEKSIAQNEHLAFRYATEIIRGKLPEEMHNIMLAKGATK